MGSLFQQSVKKQFFGQLNKILFSYPKTGKTTFASMQTVDGKPPLFIPTEDGHHELGCYCTSMVSTWEEFIAVVKHIIANKEQVQKEHSCIVLDLTSDLADMVGNYVCAKQNIEDLGDLEWGKGYNLQLKEFKRVVSHLFTVLPLTFISHSKVKDIEEKGVVKKDIITPDLPKKIYGYLNGKCDVIGFIMPKTSDKSKPLINFAPSERVQCGSRIKIIAKAYPLDIDNMETTYKAIEKEMGA